MTNISRTTLRELKKRYLNILKKCFLANLGLILLSVPAIAESIWNPVDLYENLLNKNSRAIINIDYEGENKVVIPDTGAVFTYLGEPVVDENGDFVLDEDGNQIYSYPTQGGLLVSYWDRNIEFSGGKITFKNNKATQSGGVMYFSGNNNVYLTESDFIENSSESSGGAIENGKGFISFSGNANFIKNNAGGFGGAIINGGEMLFVDAIFDENTVTNINNNALGGAIRNFGRITFNSAIFRNNRAIYNATNLEASGGAIHNEGANTVLIFNDESLFKNNKAESETGNAKGGAIRNSGGSVVFEGTDNNAETPAVPNITYGMTFKGDTLFTGNKAESETGSSLGGAIHNSGYMLLGGENTFGGYLQDTEDADGDGDKTEYILDSEGNKISLGNEAKDGGAIYNSGGKKEGDVIAYGMTLGKAIFMGNTALSRGGAIYNSGYMNFTDEAVFEGNTSSATGGDSYGGAIGNPGSITFDALATFEGNSTTATGANSHGGAISISNSGSITFGRLAMFDGNSATATGGHSYGGAIWNKGSITFDALATFDGNSAIATGGTSYGGAIWNFNNAIINFNNRFTFTGNKTISKGVEATNDIYNSGTINFNHGLDENNNPLIGSLDGGISNYGTINKTGAGTLILGDGMKNSGTGTFTQSAGLTIAHADKLTFATTNTITGGELRIHGVDTNKLKASVSNGAMLTYLTTRTERQNVALGTNVSVIGANVTFGAYEGVEQAQYTLGSDIASDARALKVIIQDSNIKMTGDTYAGSYEIGSSNVIEMRDESIEEQSVTFADLDGSGATLGIDIALLKDSEGKTQLTADRLNLTSDGEGYKFAGVSFNTPMDGQALLDEILSGLMVGQDGTITPSIKHTVQVLGGNASFMGRKEATLSTASPYVYEVATAGQDLTVSADVLKGSALEYLNDTDTDVTLKIAEKGSTDYTVTEDLSSMGVGKKQILGSTSDATESVINANGKELFTLNNKDTSLTIKDLTITGAGTAIDNQAGKVTLENVVIKKSVNETALVNGAELTLKDVSVDKGVVNSGKLTMSGNNALSTLTNNGETTVEGGKLSVTTLGGNGTLTMNGAELDSTNIATNNTIVSNGMSLSNGLTTFEVKSLEVKDGTTLDLNLAMTTADKIKNEGDMIANKDLSVGGLEGTGTLTMNNATLDVADKFATSNKVVSNGMKIGDNVTSEIHFADLEIKDNTTLDIKTLQATANTVTVGENATLGITLKNLDEYGTMKADEIIAKEDSKVHLTLGDNFAGGVFDVFKGTKGSGDLEVVHNNVYNVVEVSEGKYSFMAKDTEALQESLGTTDNETVIANALTQGTTGHAVFSRMQSEMLVALQSQDAGTVAKAKKALNALGARSTSVYQSQATAQFTQMHTVITQMLMNSTAPIFGHAGGEEPARATVYVKGLYDRVNSLAGDGFRMRSKGAVLGVQSAITEYLTVGIGYAGINSVAKEPLRRTEVDTNTGFISAQYQPNNWWVNGVLTYSRSQYDEEKNILSTKGIAKYDVDSLGAQITTGYNIKRGNWIVTPEVGVRYLNARQEGYVDSLGTTVEKTTSDFVTTMAGFKVGVDLGWMRPLAGVMVGYDVVTDDISAVNTLASGATYTIKGKALDRLSTTVVAGFAADLSDNATLKLEYSGNYRKEYLDHSGMLRLEWKF